MKKKTLFWMGAAAAAAACAATAAIILKRRNDDESEDFWDEFETEPNVTEKAAPAREEKQEAAEQQESAPAEQKEEEESEEQSEDAEGDIPSAGEGDAPAEEETPEDASGTVTFTLKDKKVSYSLGEDKPTHLFVLESGGSEKEIAITAEQYANYVVGDEIVCRRTDKGCEFV